MRTLNNYNNYFIYSDLVDNAFQHVNTSDITKGNIRDHFMGCLNILRDGIETPLVHKMKIRVHFTDNKECTLTIYDYFINLIMWQLPVSVNTEISSFYLFFDYAKVINKKMIKTYIDDKFIDLNRSTIPNIAMNNYIDNCLYLFNYINEFALYFANCINNEDTLRLEKENPEFYSCTHADLTSIPLEEVKKVGQDIADHGIEIIKKTKYHGLRTSLITGEAISDKQFREFLFNIGIKPNGEGGIFPYIINSSFSSEGVNTLESYVIDSSTGRIAKILEKKNVGYSGAFARNLGLSNQNTMAVHYDPTYDCRTNNYVKVYIENAQMLNMYKHRYYKKSPTAAILRHISSKPDSNPNDLELIGKTIYLRSPMTCACHKEGMICYKCYGDLAYNNSNINIGKIAAELVSSQLTQRLLSAKHLLEAKVKALQWVPAFNNFFELYFNMIQIKEDIDINLKKYHIIINEENLELVSKTDDFDYNDYITSFSIETPNGELIDIYTENIDNIYITKEFRYIMDHNLKNGQYIINMDSVKDIPLFIMDISNSELAETLENIKNIIDRDADIRVNKDYNEFNEKFVKNIIKGGIYVDAIHCEMIISNQLKSIEDVTKEPDWNIPDVPYQMVTMHKALIENASITTSMLYEQLPKALINPRSFKKTSPSINDLYFMTKPKQYMEYVPKVERKRTRLFYHVGPGSAELREVKK